MRVGQLFVLAMTIACLYCAALGQPATTPSIFVSVSGNDSSSGDNWLTPKRTIESAIAEISVTGGNVFVAQGIYHERIVIPDKVFVYGGYSGDFSAPFLQNPSRYPTILDGDGIGTVVTIFSSMSQTSGIIGCGIQNGVGNYGGGVACRTGTPLIRNCHILNNSALQGGGIYIFYVAGASIEDNLIEWNQAQDDGGGVYVMAPCDLTRNTIRHNAAADEGGAIAMNRQGMTISENTLAFNLASKGGAISTAGWAQTIEGNVVLGNYAEIGGGLYNAAVNASGGLVANNAFLQNTSDGAGAAAYLSIGRAPGLNFINNTVADNLAGSQTGTVHIVAGPVTIANTIIAFNGSGIWKGASAAVSLSSNCLYQNVEFDYRNLLVGPNDFSVDPMFIDHFGGDVHLAPSSPCINRGNDAMASSSASDFDEQARKNLRVDVGADEFYDRITTVAYVMLADRLSAGPLTNLPVRATFDDGAMFTLSLNGNGSYGYCTTSVTSPGVHTVQLKPSGYLAQRKNFSTTGANIRLEYLGPDDERGLVAGDTDDDNAVSDGDLLDVILDFGGAQSNMFGITDANADGVVDDADLLLVILAYGLVGDP